MIKYIQVAKGNIQVFFAMGYTDLPSYEVFFLFLHIIWVFGILLYLQLSSLFSLSTQLKLLKQKKTYK